MPEVALNALDPVGQMAIPLMLLGVAVVRMRLAAFGPVAVLTVVKLVGCAAIAHGVGQAFSLGPVQLAVLTVQLATPVAVTSCLLAVCCGAQGNPGQASSSSRRCYPWQLCQPF